MAMMNPECMRCVFLFGPQAEQLTQALEYIQICGEVWRTLKATGSLSSSPSPPVTAVFKTSITKWGATEMCSPHVYAGSSPMDRTDTLLLLYEFEARAKLNDPKAEAVLESVLELENVETKVLETIAGKSEDERRPL